MNCGGETVQATISAAKDYLKGRISVETYNRKIGQISAKRKEQKAS